MGTDRASDGRLGRLVEVGHVFLRLGATTFGGPAAHIARFEEELVRRRGWLTREELLDLVGAANLIPGPNSTEVAIHAGLRRAGFPGLVVAGVAFIAPAALATTALAWAYVRYGALPRASGALAGMQPVIVAIVTGALVRLAMVAARDKRLSLIGAGAAVAALVGTSEIAILAAAGALAMIVRPRAKKGDAAALVAPASLAAAGGAASASTLGVFLVFLKIGALLFGSGYVLLAFLRTELVVTRGWLTETQLLDAVAAGQVTPGPLFTTATFVGYLLGRGPGAAAATAGIFLPAFVLVAASGPLVPRLRKSPAAGAFLDGVNVGSMGLMLIVTVTLGRHALVDLVSIASFVIAFVLLVAQKRIGSFWLVAAGAAIGALRGG